MKATALVAVLALSAGVVHADEIPTDLQVELQSAMLSYTDSILDDGAYSYIDTEEDALRTVYPAQVHPFVVPFGDDYFLCSEMVTDEGAPVTADFLIRRIGGAYRVVQLILDDRPAVQAAMAKLGN